MRQKVALRFRKSWLLAWAVEVIYALKEESVYIGLRKEALLARFKMRNSSTKFLAAPELLSVSF